MEIDRIELGTLIRQRRKELGLTLNDLADGHLSVPRSVTLKGERLHRISEDNLAYIMKRLDLTEESLKEMQQQSDEARNELRELEKEDDIADYPFHRISLQLQKGVLFRKGCS